MYTDSIMCTCNACFNNYEYIHACSLVHTHNITITHKFALIEDGLHDLIIIHLFNHDSMFIKLYACKSEIQNTYHLVKLPLVTGG